MKILYLFARKWYDQKMSIGRLLYGQAVARHADLKFSGVGWPDWNAELSVSDNIASMGWTPDWIWVYKGEDYPTLKDCRIPKVVVFNEANADKTRDEIEAADATLVGFHHQNDMPRWANIGRRLFSLPHCCDVDEQALPHDKRSVFCIAAGVRADAIYPLRGRMMHLIQTGAIPGTIRRHPGYRLQGHDAVHRQWENYRADMRAARVALVCSSIYRYPLAKYVEAAAAGCLVIGDMPDDAEFRETLGRFIVEVPRTASDAEITSLVRHWLDRPDEAQERALAGQECVRDRLITDHYARRLLEKLTGRDATP